MAPRPVDRFSTVQRPANADATLDTGGRVGGPGAQFRKQGTFKDRAARSFAERRSDRHDRREERKETRRAERRSKKGSGGRSRDSSAASSGGGGTAELGHHGGGPRHVHPRSLPPGLAAGAPATHVSPSDGGNAPPTSVGRRKALLVGINYPGTTAELRGCYEDVKNMLQILKDSYGWTSSNSEIKVLSDVPQAASERSVVIML